MIHGRLDSPTREEGRSEREREKQTDLRMPSCPFFSLEVDKMTLLKDRAFACCLLCAQFFYLQQNSIYCYSQFIDQEIEAHRGFRTCLQTESYNDNISPTNFNHNGMNSFLSWFHKMVHFLFHTYIPSPFLAQSMKELFYFTTQMVWKKELKHGLYLIFTLCNPS